MGTTEGSKNAEGILEYCILAILSREDSYARRSSPVKAAEMIVVEGTLYPILTRQKNAGLLTYRWEESPQGPPRKYYTLTEKGHGILRTLDEAWDELVGRSTASATETPKKTSEPLKTESHEKIPVDNHTARDAGGRLCPLHRLLRKRPVGQESNQGQQPYRHEGDPHPRVRCHQRLARHPSHPDGAGDQIRIDANDNLMEWVVVQAEARKLRITIDPEIKQVRNMKVTVTVPVGNRTLRLLEASSAAEIQGKEVEIKTSALQVKASSAAEIQTSVKAQSCEIDASSAATVKATVKAATCDIDASSAATVRAEVQAQSCSADASSAADIGLKGGTIQFEGSSSSAGKIHAAESGLDARRGPGFERFEHLGELYRAAQGAGFERRIGPLHRRLQGRSLENKRRQHPSKITIPPTPHTTHNHERSQEMQHLGRGLHHGYRRL